MNINVHGGHNAHVTGASVILDELKEDRIVKNEVIRLLKAEGHTVFDCTDDDGKTQTQNLKNIVAKCNKHTVTLDLSIHLNSGRDDEKGDGSTGGVEVLVYSDESKANVYAERICKQISNDLGIRNRGVKVRSGLYVLANTKSPALLVECCFVDDADDAKKWDAMKCANAIVKGVLNKSSLTGSSNKPAEPSKPSTGESSSSSSYYKAFKSTSIVDGLNSIGVDSSMVNREKIAAANGISNYSGTSSQNVKLLELAEKGKLKKAGSSSSSSSSSVSYYKAFKSTSIVDGLKSIGVDSSMTNRKKIAKANGISNYSGTSSQNEKLLDLASKGKLKKA